MDRHAAETRSEKTCEEMDCARQGTVGTDQSAVGKGRRAVVALLPFLVKGALSLSVLRAMRNRGFDITIAYYMSEAVGYTRDPAEDFAAKGRLVDMTDAAGIYGVNRLEQLVRERGSALV